MMKKSLFVAFFFLALLAVGIIAGTGSEILNLLQPQKQDQPGADAGNKLASPAIQSAGQAKESPFMAPAWEALPPCVNNPASAGEWQQLLANAGQAAQQAALLAPETSFHLQDQEAASAVTVLALNVASGRLNRASEIQVAGMPEVKTVGALLERLRSTAPGESPDAALLEASLQLQVGQSVVNPVCARLLVTQPGQPLLDSRWSGRGLLASSMPVDPVSTARKVLGNGILSPDGQWAAFRSGGMDTGGPVFVYNLQSGEWRNLLAQAAFQGTETPDGMEDWWWTVIGWFPDSRRLLIAPADLNGAYIADRASSELVRIPLNTIGVGGSDFITLSPDGRQMAYVGSDMDGEQSLYLYDFASNEVRLLMRMSSQEGLLLFPRFSPDGQSIAYVLETGHPLRGVSYDLHLYTIETGGSAVLVEGNIGRAVPAWSPDGQYLAISRQESDRPDVVVPGQANTEPVKNVWVVSAHEGTARQVTFLSGQADNPQWANNSTTLSFITHDGQVGLADLQQPGKVWRVAQAGGDFPTLTSALFVP